MEPRIPEQPHGHVIWPLMMGAAGVLFMRISHGTDRSLSLVRSESTLLATAPWDESHNCHAPLLTAGILHEVKRPSEQMFLVRASIPRVVELKPMFSHSISFTSSKFDRLLSSQPCAYSYRKQRSSSAFRSSAPRAAYAPVDGLGSPHSATTLRHEAIPRLAHSLGTL